MNFDQREPTCFMSCRETAGNQVGRVRDQVEKGLMHNRQSASKKGEPLSIWGTCTKTRDKHMDFLMTIAGLRHAGTH